LMKKYTQSIWLNFNKLPSLFKKVPVGHTVCFLLE